MKFITNKIKVNNPVVLIDMGINGLNALNSIKNALPKEDIIYINDYEVPFYEGLDHNEIEKRITNLVRRALAYKPKLVVIVNDTLIEYGKEIIQKELNNIPWVNIVDEVISEVQTKYEAKNMAFFAPFGIIEANLYQKNFTYARLYNLNADNILNIMNEAKIKTNESFSDMRNAMSPLYKKDVDVIIPTLPNILLFYTEIYEYAPSGVEIIKVSDLLASKAKKLIKEENGKNKKYTYVVVKDGTKEKDKCINIYNKILSCPFKCYLEKIDSNK